MEKKKPCYEQRIGNIRVAVWENLAESNGGGGNSAPRLWYNVALSRRYKVGTQWQEASTLNGLGDLAQAKVALGLAEQWITHRQDVTPAAEHSAQ